MSWVSIDDRMPTHPKVLKLSDAAFRLWFKLLCHANEHATDGHISREAMGELCGSKSKEIRIRSLTVSGLLERSEDGFVIHDYLEYQQSREQIRARKKANAERVAAWRDAQAAKCNGVTNALRTPLVMPPSPLPIREEEKREEEIPQTPLAAELPRPVAIPVEEPAQDDRPVETTPEQRYAMAWAAGVARGADLPSFAAPVGRECGYIARTIQAHAKCGAGKGLRGAPLLAWLDGKGEQFARSVDPRYGGLKAARFFEWVNAGCKNEADRPSGVWKRAKPLMQVRDERWDPCNGAELLIGDDMSVDEFEKNLAEMRKTCSPSDVANYARQRGFLTGTG